MPVDVDAATFVRADTGTAIRTIHDILGFDNWSHHRSQVCAVAIDLS